MQRTLTPLSRLLGLAVLLLCGGCDLEFPEQEVRFRYDVEADTLDVLIIYQGVRSEDDTEKALGKGRDHMNLILAGRREFMFFDWPFHFDLDEELEEGGGYPPAYQAFVDRVELLRVEALLDEYQRLCVLQHFRLSEVSTVLPGANREFHASALEALDAGEVPMQGRVWFDAAEEAGWREFIESETPWVSLEGGQVVVRYPITTRGAARTLESLARPSGGSTLEDLHELAMLLVNLSNLQISDGVAEFHIGRVEGALTVLRSKRENGPYSGALRDLLVDEGLDLSGAPTLDEARAQLDAEIPQPAASGSDD